MSSEGASVWCEMVNGSGGGVGEGFQGKVLIVCHWPGDLIHIRLGTRRRLFLMGGQVAREPNEKVTSAWKQHSGPSWKNPGLQLCFLVWASVELGLSEASKRYQWSLCYLCWGKAHPPPPAPHPRPKQLLFLPVTTLHEHFPQALGDLHHFKWMPGRPLNVLE